jgi:hypothetical protein
VTATLLTSPAVVALLVGELLFWVLLVAGLAARYLLRRPRLGAGLLGSTVLVDLGILATAVIDIRAGGTATAAHGLAALYIGFSVAFGPSLVRWADVRAAHRWAGGPAPVKVPREGPERAAHEWSQFGRWVVAAILCAAVLGLVHLLAGPDADLALLTPWFGRLGIVTVIWFVTGPARFLGARHAVDR